MQTHRSACFQDFFENQVEARLYSLYAKKLNVTRVIYQISIS